MTDSSNLGFFVLGFNEKVLERLIGMLKSSPNSDETLLLLQDCTDDFLDDDQDLLFNLMRKKSDFFKILINIIGKIKEHKLEIVAQCVLLLNLFKKKLHRNQELFHNLSTLPIYLELISPDSERSKYVYDLIINILREHPEPIQALAIASNQKFLPHIKYFLDEKTCGNTLHALKNIMQFPFVGHCLLPFDTILLTLCNSNQEFVRDTATLIRKYLKGLPPKTTGPVPEDIRNDPCPCGCTGSSSKCANQGEVYPKTMWVAVPPTENVPSSGVVLAENHLFGKIAGVCGFLVIDPTITEGIWRCELRFVQSRGLAHYGIVGISQDYPLGNFEDTKQTCYYESKGDCQQSGKCVGMDTWKAGQMLGLEINMRDRTIYYFLAGKQQNVSYSKIPTRVRIYAYSIVAALIHIVSLKKIPTPTAVPARPTLEAKLERQIPWNSSGITKDITYDQYQLLLPPAKKK